MNKTIKNSLMSLCIFGIVGSISPAKEPGLYITHIENDSYCQLMLCTHHKDLWSNGIYYPGATRELPTTTNPIRVPADSEEKTAETIRVIPDSAVPALHTDLTLLVKKDEQGNSKFYMMQEWFGNPIELKPNFPSLKVVTARLRLKAEILNRNVPNEDRAELTLKIK